MLLCFLTVVHQALHVLGQVCGRLRKHMRIRSDAYIPPDIANTLSQAEQKIEASRLNPEETNVRNFVQLQNCLVTEEKLQKQSVALLAEFGTWMKLHSPSLHEECRNFWFVDTRMYVCITCARFLSTPATTGRLRG